MKNYWGTAAVIFLINLCLTGPAYAWGDGWGGADSGVQESSGSGWQSSGSSISIEKVTYADSGVLLPDTTLYCLSGSVSYNGGTSGMIAVNDSQGDSGYVNGNDAWFVGNGFVSGEDLGLLNFFGVKQFDEFAVRANDLEDASTDVDYQQTGWDDQRIFLEDYQSSGGDLLCVTGKEGIYVFSTAKVSIEDGKNTVDVPNVITELSDLKEGGDGSIEDYGFYSIGRASYGRPYQKVDPDDMFTQVQLEDGSAAMVSIGRLSSVVDSDKIAVLDAGGNTWYVDEGDIEENEDMEFLYQVFTQ